MKILLDILIVLIVWFSLMNIVAIFVSFGMVYNEKYGKGISERIIDFWESFWERVI